MHPESDPLAQHFPSPEELRVLEERWQKGVLKSRVDSILHFTTQNRDELAERLGDAADPSAIVRTLQALIAEKGSAHLAAELKDQIKEMQAEIWYRGERGETDQFKIKQEWTQRHALAWRMWRIKEYLFAAERSSGIIAEQLKRTGTD